MGIYLGQSAQHSPTVSLIHNPRTGYLSRHFHCVFDDKSDSPKYDESFLTFWAENVGLIHSRENEPEARESMQQRQQ